MIKIRATAILPNGDTLPVYAVDLCDGITWTLDPSAATEWPSVADALAELHAAELAELHAAELNPSWLDFVPSDRC